jgi:DNA-binding ferritin-like protein
MAALLKVRKEDEEKGKSKLNPEAIQSKLFYLSDAAHKLHLDTKSYAQHKALGKLYEGLVDFRDDISEKLMGYMDGKRIGSIKIGALPEYTEKAPMELAKEVREFGSELCEFAGENGYSDVENVAQALSGLGASTVYLLTLT